MKKAAEMPSATAQIAWNVQCPNPKCQIQINVSQERAELLELSDHDERVFRIVMPADCPKCKKSFQLIFT